MWNDFLFGNLQIKRQKKLGNDLFAQPQMNKNFVIHICTHAYITYDYCLHKRKHNQQLQFSRERNVDTMTIL